ncbi:MAG: DNA-3-methyladenine glycosylase I [SAR324 cluster bacterium]|nr:DNA-3-methyladenine glycosylase I [SAR324 cluster bacterium]
MKSFASIWKRAAKRKGGDRALEAEMPPIKTPAQLRKIPGHRWLAEMTRRIFSAGFVWKVIENKWEGFEAAFEGFDPGRLATLGQGDLGRLVSDTRIVRNHQKISAVRHNAGFLVELAREHGTAAAWFADWPDDDFVGLLEAMKKRGSRLGGITGQVFLRFMGRDSFILNPDVTTALVDAGALELAPASIKAVVSRRRVSSKKAVTSKQDLAAVQAAFNQWRSESGRPMAHISKTLACSVGE